MRFSGVNIYSREPERLSEYYKCFGLRLLEAPEAGEYYGAVYALEIGQETGNLWIWRNMAGQELTKNHLVFHCESLDTRYRELIAAGIDCQPPFTAAWGGRELVLRDPDGNWILILEE